MATSLVIWNSLLIHRYSLQYVTDPNAIIADASWMNCWPSYFTSQKVDVPAARIPDQQW
jgi:hypothetical protein